MKKIFLLLSIIGLLNSCSIVGGAIGGTTKIIGATVGVGGKIVSSVIGNKNDGNIKARDTEYKFDKVEVIIEKGLTTVIGELKHDGTTKSHLTIEIPCFDKNKVKIGDAVDSINSLERGEIWEFSAKLNNGNTNFCKINDSYIFQDIESEVIKGNVN